MLRMSDDGQSGTSLRNPSDRTGLVYRRPSPDLPSSSPSHRQHTHHHHRPKGSSNTALLAYPPARRMSIPNSDEGLSVGGGVGGSGGFEHERDGAGSPKDYWQNKVLPGEETETRRTVSDNRNESTIFTVRRQQQPPTNVNTHLLNNYNKVTAHKALFDSKQRATNAFSSTPPPFSSGVGWRTLPGTQQEVFARRSDRLNDQADMMSEPPPASSSSSFMAVGGGSNNSPASLLSSTEPPVGSRWGVATGGGGVGDRDGYMRTPVAAVPVRSGDYPSSSSPLPFRARGGEGAEGGRPFGAPPPPSSHPHNQPLISSAVDEERGGGEQQSPQREVIQFHQQQQQHRQVEGAAAKLLQQIEALSEEVKSQRHKRHEAENTVDRYERMLGPSDKFAATQVHLREELVKLRAHASRWSLEEQQLKDKVKDLEGSLRQSAYGSYFTNSNTNHTSAISQPSKPAPNANNAHANRIHASRARLENLQDRLGSAFGTRTRLLEELSEVQALTDTYDVLDATSFSTRDDMDLQDDGIHNNTGTADGTGAVSSTHHTWRMRGRRADVELRIRTQDKLIRTISSAVEVERECLEGLGVSDVVGTDGTVGKKETMVSLADRSQSVPIPEEMVLGVEPPSTSGALGGEKTVEDQRQQQQRQITVRPGPEVEIARLMGVLELKNAQISQMRDLLNAVAKSGKLGVGEPVGDLHKANLLGGGGGQSSPSAKGGSNGDGVYGNSTIHSKLKSSGGISTGSSGPSGEAKVADGSGGGMVDSDAPLFLPSALTSTDASLISSAFKLGEPCINQMVPPNSPSARPIQLPMDTLAHLAERDEARLADIKHALKEGKAISPYEGEESGGGTGAAGTSCSSSALLDSPYYTVLRAGEYDYSRAVDDEIEFRKGDVDGGGPLSRREEDLIVLYEKQLAEVRRQMRARDAENSVINRRCTEVMLQMVTKNERIAELERKLLSTTHSHQ